MISLFWWVLLFDVFWVLLFCLLCVLFGCLSLLVDT